MVETLHPEELNWARAPPISHFHFGYSKKSIYELGGNMFLHIYIELYGCRQCVVVLCFSFR